MTELLKFPAGLYGVTPDWDDQERLEHAVRQASVGGMTSLQLRLKTVAPATRLSIAKRLREVCAQLKVVFLVNDDWQLAQAVQADGVHLGRDDADPFVVRKAVGHSMLIGVSCYADLERARHLLEVPADYIAFGAMFASSTKPTAPPAPTAILSQAKAMVQTAQALHKKSTQRDEPRCAIVAIGGITPENASTLTQAGADSLAVVGALFNAPNIQTVAQRFRQLF